jgi:hypothetical protein
LRFLKLIGLAVGAGAISGTVVGEVSAKVLAISMPAKVAFAASAPHSLSVRKDYPLAQYETGSMLFRFIRQPEAFLAIASPKTLTMAVLEGWDREQEAFGDRQALLYISGPMYENAGLTDRNTHWQPLGDLKMGDRVIHSQNRAAAYSRAYIAFDREGHVDFGYGELTPERERRYEVFIGGLHALYNDQQSPPPRYRPAYESGAAQTVRYYLPRTRIVYGLTPRGSLVFLMSYGGWTLQQTEDNCRKQGLVAAYLPDHASKSRFIIPGQYAYSHYDVNGPTEGVLTYSHVPYMLRLGVRGQQPDIVLSAWNKDAPACKDLSCKLHSLLSFVGL